MNRRLTSFFATGAALLAVAGCLQHDSSRHIQTGPAPDPRSPALAESDSEFRQVAVSPEGYVLAAADKSRELRLWNLETQKVVQTMELDAPEPGPLLFSPDGDSLLVRGSDSKLLSWDVVNAKLKWSAACGNTSQKPLAYATNGESVAAACREEKGWVVKTWDSTNGQELITVPSSSQAMALALTRQSRLTIIDQPSSGIVQLIEIQAGQTPVKPKTILQGKRGVGFIKAAIAPGQKTIACTDSYGNIMLWERGNNSSHTIKASRNSFVLLVAFSADGKQLLSASVPTGVTYDGSTALQVWDVQKKTKIDSFQTKGDVRSAVFLPDGTVAYGDGKTLHLWKRSAKATH